MPAYETAVEGPGRRRAPEGGWEKWLDEITAHRMPHTDRTADPAAKFQQTLKSAEGGSVPAQAALGMMYATGKGVQQNYGEASSGGSKPEKAAISLPPVSRGKIGAPKVSSGIGGRRATREDARRDRSRSTHGSSARGRSDACKAAVTVYLTAPGAHPGPTFPFKIGRVLVASGALF